MVGGRILGVPGRSEVFRHLDRSHLQSKRERAEQRAPSPPLDTCGGDTCAGRALAPRARLRPRVDSSSPAVEALGRQAGGLLRVPCALPARTAVCVRDLGWAQPLTLRPGPRILVSVSRRMAAACLLRPWQFHARAATHV